jgi:hypothetical protein
MIPFGFMKSASAAVDLTTFDWDGLWRADGTEYNGSPWAPTASAGNSGSNGNIVTLGTAPGTGTAVNGKTPASFNGSTQAFGLDTASTSNIVSNGAFSVVVLAKASASTAAATDFYDDPALWMDSGGNAGLVFTSSGVRAGVFNASSGQTTHIAQATGAWFMAAIRYDGANVHCRVNSTDATPVGKGSPTMGANSYFGKNYASAKFFAGEILFIGTTQAVISDAGLANIKSGLNSYYALSL